MTKNPSSAATSPLRDVSLVSSALHQVQRTASYLPLNSILRLLSLVLRVTIFELVVSQDQTPVCLLIPRHMTVGERLQPDLPHMSEQTVTRREGAHLTCVAAAAFALRVESVARISRDDSFARNPV
jgi:hypothetical protein